MTGLKQDLPHPVFGNSRRDSNALHDFQPNQTTGILPSGSPRCRFGWRLISVITNWKHWSDKWAQIKKIALNPDFCWTT